MTQSFKDFPIQRKMLLLTLMICGAVLLAAAAAMFLFQIVNFRYHFQRDTATLGGMPRRSTMAGVSKAPPPMEVSPTTTPTPSPTMAESASMSYRPPESRLRWRRLALDSIWRREAEAVIGPRKPSVEVPTRGIAPSEGSTGFRGLGRFREGNPPATTVVPAPERSWDNNSDKDRSGRRSCAGKRTGG